MGQPYKKIAITLQKDLHVQVEDRARALGLSVSAYFQQLARRDLYRGGAFEIPAVDLAGAVTHEEQAERISSALASASAEDALKAAEDQAGVRGSSRKSSTGGRNAPKQSPT